MSSGNEPEIDRLAEVARDYAWNRALFMRVRHGRYQFNPRLAVRDRSGGQETWRPAFAALNLPLINEFALEFLRPDIHSYLEMANLPGVSVPVAAERAVAREQERQRVREEEQRRIEQARRDREAALAARESLRAAFSVPTAEAPRPFEPKWGTPEAKRLERAKLRRRIAELRRREGEGSE